MSVFAHADSVLPLAEVNRVDSSAIGYAGSASPNYEAFKAELARGEAARPLFEKLIKEGTPAAKIYSAMGLYGLDQRQGRQALVALQNDKSKLELMTG
jgi:hypothetical protein